MNNSERICVEDNKDTRRWEHYQQEYYEKFLLKKIKSDSDDETEENLRIMQDMQLK